MKQTALVLAFAVIAGIAAEVIGPQGLNAQPEEPPPDEGPVACQGAVVLIAGHTFHPLSWDDATATLPYPVAFRLPKRIPVTLGNAGRGIVVFSFVPPSDQRISCLYQGTAGAAPQPPTGGREYEFVTCGHGARPGDEFEAQQFRLRVVSGDRTHPANRVEVRLELGEIPDCGHVIEEPNPLDARQDPAVRGDPFDPNTLPPNNPNPEQREEAFTAATSWVGSIVPQLGAGAMHTVTVALTEPGLVLAQANGTGSTGPVALDMSGGQIVIQDVQPVPPNAVTAVTQAVVSGPTQVTVTFRNLGQSTLEVNLIVGTLPFSVAR
jgi:hypothetical protein